ncbi:MAG: riboflavin synthase [candidate division Zixibacteria bacterium]|nr:riboflavin synthase [candidate division Zixibacteria bacterium]
MFTGIIEATGTVRTVEKRGNYRVLSITAPTVTDELRVGDSIACDGACLTVVSCSSKTFVVEASQETVGTTILNGYRAGSIINLERALKVGDRLGGHFVSGHVDGTGRVQSIRDVGESVELAVTFDARFDEMVVEKGSIAINGISLTVNSVRSGWLSVNLIPHTVRVTSLGKLNPGDLVNVEFDLIGKHVIKVTGKTPQGRLTKEKLRESGWNV